LRLTEEIRGAFRKPLGTLVPNSAVSAGSIRAALGDGMLVTVGDATTERMLGYGIVPSVQLVDGLEKRGRRDLPDGGAVRTHLQCENRPGWITEEAVSAIGEALRSPKPARILVNGEEDLLVLPVCVLVPDGTLVLYGQPNRGLVMVPVDEQTRNKARSLLDLMEGA
jgi:uncharacterized protein (UPF0218 family)